MLYLTGSGSREVRSLIRRGAALGMMLTPRSETNYHGGAWAADSGCFNAKTYVGDQAYYAWLQRRRGDAETCLFVSAPDVVGDHAATLARSVPWFPRIRALGFPVAFVGQDGATVETVPWGDFDWLFIGGTTEWKLGADARALIAHAKTLGTHVHMGRVNSEKRLRYAKFLGCDTADGTFLAFGPDVNLPRVLSWLRGVNDQYELEL